MRSHPAQKKRYLRVIEGPRSNKAILMQIGQDQTVRVEFQKW